MSNIKIFHFNKFFFLGFNKKQDKLYNHNDEKYMVWSLNFIKTKAKQHGVHNLPSGYIWNPKSLSVNTKNHNFLFKRLSPIVYLSYAPYENNLLKNNEVSIDFDKIFTVDRTLL